jgi:hypothetical protein
VASNAHGQVQDLGARIVREQPAEEGVVDGEVVQGVKLGVLDGQFLTLIVGAALLVTIELAVEPLVKAVPRLRRGSEVESYRAVIDLRDAHPHRFTNSQGEDALFIYCSGDVRRRLAHFRSKLPQPLSLGSVSIGNGDAGH